MNRIAALIAILLTVSSVTCIAQEDGADPEAINQVVAGVRQGHWIVKSLGGKTQEGLYVNGKKEGLWVTTMSDGSVRAKVTYSAGLPIGCREYYYPNGTIMEKGVWNIDHWEGGYERFYDSGTIACKFTYNSDGQRDGRQVYYHENGRVMYDGTWIGGKIDSVLSVYDDRGRKLAERYYDKKGAYNSTQTLDVMSDDGGAPFAVGNEFTTSGNLTLFNSNGQKEQSGKFVNGKLINGEKYFYDSAGKLIKTETYRNGKPISQKP